MSRPVDAMRLLPFRARWPGGRIAVRGAGGAIALAGIVFLSRMV
jgi:hypothetical protein